MAITQTLGHSLNKDREKKPYIYIYIYLLKFESIILLLYLIKYV